MCPRQVGDHGRERGSHLLKGAVLPSCPFQALQTVDAFVSEQLAGHLLNGASEAATPPGSFLYETSLLHMWGPSHGNQGVIIRNNRILV